MKKRILLIALIKISFGINAQNTFPTTGNVGIGTNNPMVNLDIASNSFGLPATSGSTPNGFLRIGYTQRSWGGTEILSGIINSETYDYAAYIQAKNPIDYSHNRTFLINPQGGNVGIGTTNPSEKLEIKGKGKFLSSATGLHSIEIDGYLGISTSGNAHWLHLNRYKNDNVAIGHNSTSNIFLVNGGGNVGIDTIDTKGFKLGVNGKIAAEEVKVALYNNWSDFVFEPTYNLPTLKQVKTHIKEKGHLKDIPSAKEVEKNGIELGDMNARLLQKIEELTLYTITQEEKIEKVEKQNESLKFLATKFLELQKRLEELEKK